MQNMPFCKMGNSFFGMRSTFASCSELSKVHYPSDLNVGFHATAQLLFSVLSGNKYLIVVSFQLRAKP